MSGRELCCAIWPQGQRTATGLFYFIVKAWSLVPLRRWHNTSCIVQHPLIKHPIAQPCIAMEFFAAQTLLSTMHISPYATTDPTHKKNKCSRVNMGAFLSHASFHQKDTVACLVSKNLAGLQKKGLFGVFLSERSYIVYFQYRNVLETMLSMKYSYHISDIRQNHTLNVS